MVLASRPRRAVADVVTGQADEALDAHAVRGVGEAVADDVADAEGAAAVAGVGHVDGDPVARDGEAGQHGGATRGRELEDVGLQEVHGAEELDGGEGEADGHAEEVGDDPGGRGLVGVVFWGMTGEGRSRYSGGGIVCGLVVMLMAMRVMGEKCVCVSFGE